MASSIHPAQFPAYMVPVLTKALKPYAIDGGRLVDPFAGLGHRLREIADALGMVPTGIEIEPGFVAAADPCVIQGDATVRRDYPRTVRAIVTSPTYPNGINDYFRSAETDTSRRNTYIHRLREHLGPDYEMSTNNSGRYNARGGAKSLARYYEIHRAAIGVWARVLDPEGAVVLNTKNVVNPDGSIRVDVTGWFNEAMRAAGFRKVASRDIEAQGLRHGTNHEQRADYETINTYRLKR